MERRKAAKGRDLFAGDVALETVAALGVWDADLFDGGGSGMTGVAIGAHMEIVRDGWRASRECGAAELGARRGFPCGGAEGALCALWDMALDAVCVGGVGGDGCKGVVLGDITALAVAGQASIDLAVVFEDIVRDMWWGTRISTLFVEALKGTHRRTGGCGE